ncbi:EAL domain-containing protein [Lysobacter tyrosinilyticus]
MPDMPRPAEPRILVADDDAFIVELVATLLREAGFSSVSTASDGHSAIARLAEAPADLLICDLNMPGMDGIRLMSHVASGNAPPAIIVLSGEDPRVLDASRQFAEAKKLPLVGVLGKPITRESLQEMLEAWQRREEQARVCSQPADFGIANIRRGIDTGAVHLVYQPKLDLDSGEMVGVEALLRWMDPELGLIPAPQVIQAAESASLMEPLTLEILRRAIVDRQRLVHEGIDLNVAVNVSMHSLHDVGMIDRMHGLVVSANEHPSRYTLEVTETHLMEDPAAVLEVLIRARLQGFRIAIDDYGTGAATMQFLQQLPSNELKIDRRFVVAAPQSEQGRVLLQSAIELGLRLNQTVVAEGVETEQQASLVRELGCRFAQGFLYARPMRVTELLQWAARDLGAHAASPN